MRTPLLTTHEVAQRLAISRRTLENYRNAGVGPSFIRIGRLVRYCADDIDRWLIRTGRVHSGPDCAGGHN